MLPFNSSRCSTYLELKQERSSSYFLPPNSLPCCDPKIVLRMRYLLHAVFATFDKVGKTIFRILKSVPERGRCLVVLTTTTINHHRHHHKVVNS